jgi:hypothetical protein
MWFSEAAGKGRRPRSHGKTFFNDEAGMCATAQIVTHIGDLPKMVVQAENYRDK